MEFLFLIIVFIAIIAGEAFLDNFWWIGIIGIIIFIISIIRQIKELVGFSKSGYRFGTVWDGVDIFIILMKIAAIAGIVAFNFIL